MKNKKKLIYFFALLGCVLGLTSCTKSFCTIQDQASVLINLDDYQEGETYGNYGENSLSYKINESATKNGYLVPSEEFNNFMETKITQYIALMRNYTDETGNKPYANENETYLRGIATYTGNDTLDSYEAKMAGTATAIDYTKNTLWHNFDLWVNEAKAELGYESCPDNSYLALYKNTYNNQINAYTTCITMEDGTFDNIQLEGKTWKQAFDYGLIEGLLVYPVSYLIYTFSMAFGLNGWGQIGAIFLVTLIVRGILILLTFRQTMSQQRMTALKPELDKLQAKYPNSQTNQYEKSRLAQEQMALYKKHKINPLGMIFVMIFQFPIFIAVWGAMRGSAVLMTGTIAGLQLSAATGQSMITWTGPWYVAWIVFILMAGAQFVSMQLPNWIQKKNAKAQPKLGKNPSGDQAQQTTKMMTYVMLIMILFMGLQLPIAMSIYWFLSALISLGQTLVIQAIIKNKNENNRFKKYRTKK